jgi:hypothetical protein
MEQDQGEQVFEKARESLSITFNETSLQPLGLSAILILGLCLLLLPRKYAVVPILLLACLVPCGQRLVVFTLDFTPLRILVLIGWTRILFKGEFSRLTWKNTDTLVVIWAFCGAIAYTALHGSFSAVIYKAGSLFDIIGMYVIFRALIDSWGGVYRISYVLLLLSIPIGLFFLIEHQTGRNFFGTLGGVPEITKIREGRLRCQGAYSHPIAAGCFWASCLPLIFACFLKNEKNRFIGVVAVVATFLIIVYSASSTPIAATAAAIGAMLMFPLRHRMRFIKWCVVAVVIVLHFIMNGPVWVLIAKVDIVGGSTGYHRYNLINNTINRFGEWWLMGTKSTAHWGHFLFDQANQYVSEAVRGGVVNLILFVALLLTSFGAVGVLYKVHEGREKKELYAWVLGATLFVHCVSFVALHYPQQNQMLWLLNISLIVGLKPVVAQNETEPSADPVITEDTGCSMR